MKTTLVRSRLVSVLASRIKIAAVLLAVFCATLLVQAPAFADGFNVEIGGLVAAGSSQSGFDTGVLPQTSVTLAPLSTSFSDPFFSGNATVGGTVQLGSITGAVSATASLNSGCCAAEGNFVGVWNDTLTITSSSLALGTPVDLLFTLAVDTTSSCTGVGTVDITPVFNINGGNSQILLNSTACNSVFSQSKQLDVTTSVGAILPVQGILNLGSVVELTALGTVGTSSIDPSAGFFIDSETAGASYTTASGVNYETPVSAVPEPSSFMLLGTGLLGLTGMALRKKRLA